MVVRHFADMLGYHIEPIMLYQVLTCVFSPSLALTYKTYGCLCGHGIVPKSHNLNVHELALGLCRKTFPDHIVLADVLVIIKWCLKFNRS